MRDVTARATLDFLWNHPGASNFQVASQFRISSVAAYNRLRYLREEGLVKSQRIGNFVDNRLTPTGQRFLKKSPMLTIQDRVRHSMAEAPWMSRRQMAKRLGVSPSTVQHHVRQLNLQQPPSRPRASRTQ